MVELATLNLVLLRSQPKLCEDPISISFHLFSSLHFFLFIFYFGVVDMFMFLFLFDLISGFVVKQKEITCREN